MYTSQEKVVFISSFQHSEPRWGQNPIQEAVRLFRQLMGLKGLRRETGESMRKWTSRFEGFVSRTRAALHQADANIDADTSLHPPDCVLNGRSLVHGTIDQLVS